MPLTKFGDWDAVRKTIGKLQLELEAAQQLSLQRWALKAEAIAKKHISLQDLNWKPLAPETIAAKARQGRSTKILISTSTYFQSITSYVKGDTAYVGVKKTAKNDEGQPLADIAKTLEFGSLARNLEARPLWRPTLKQVREWHYKSNDPRIYFAKRMKL